MNGLCQFVKKHFSYTLYRDIVIILMMTSCAMIVRYAHAVWYLGYEQPTSVSVTLTILVMSCFILLLVLHQVRSYMLSQVELFDRLMTVCGLMSISGGETGLTTNKDGSNMIVVTMIKKDENVNRNFLMSVKHTGDTLSIHSGMVIVSEQQAPDGYMVPIVILPLRFLPDKVRKECESKFMKVYTTTVADEVWNGEQQKEQ